MTSPPTKAGSGASLFESCRSADGGPCTPVCALASLLPGLGSEVDDETAAVLVMAGSAPASGVTTIVMLASFATPAARAPRLHVTVVVPEHVPWLALAETSVTLEGS